jgi:putative redox protein
VAAATEVPEGKAVATIGAPFDPAHVTHLFDTDALAAIDRAGAVAVQIGGRPFRIRRHFLEDVNEQHLGAAIRNLGKALLVFHAPRDEFVDIDNARRIFEAARHPLKSRNNAPPTSGSRLRRSRPCTTPWNGGQAHNRG